MRSCVHIPVMMIVWGGCALPPVEEPSAPSQVAAVRSEGSRTFACKDGVAVPADGALRIGDREARFVRRDAAGDHFVLEGGADTTNSDAAITTEYVMPADPREDLIVWSDRGDEDTCAVRGGHSDVLARWIRGESVDEIAASLAVAPADARVRLIASMRWARSKIAYDRVRPARDVKVKAMRRPPPTAAR
jgi:hypothetical protein